MTKMTKGTQVCPARDKECLFVQEWLEDKLLSLSLEILLYVRPPLEPTATVLPQTSYM